MCLAIPGEVLSLTGSDELTRMGRVAFDGVVKEVSLVYTPEVQVGDYVLVHVGFAISVIGKAEADRIFAYLRELDEMAEPDADKGKRP